MLRSLVNWKIDIREPWMREIEIKYFFSIESQYFAKY